MYVLVVFDPVLTSKEHSTLKVSFTPLKINPNVKILISDNGRPFKTGLIIIQR